MAMLPYLYIALCTVSTQLRQCPAELSNSAVVLLIVVVVVILREAVPSSAHRMILRQCLVLQAYTTIQKI